MKRRDFIAAMRAVPWGVLLLMAACVRAPSAPEPAPMPVSPPSAESAPTATQFHAPMLLDLRDPKILESLEGSAESISLGAILQRIGGQQKIPSELQSLLTNAELEERSAAYRSLAERIRSDLKPFDESLGVPTVKVNEQAKKFPEGNVGRQFDEAWLQSPFGYFLLTGIINRFDRKDFSQGSNCGEVRLIYRLAYKKPAGHGKYYASRLPVFLNLVFEYPAQPQCAEFARLWQPPEPPGSEPLADWLFQGPLNFARLRFKQVELNAQVLRFPAGLMRDTGGQAVYLLRVYLLDSKPGVPSWAAKPLENTPNVQALHRDPRLKTELARYIIDQLPAIDRGVFNLPEKFLAREALSFSTMGNMRLANKPFDEIFKKEDLSQFSGLDFEKTLLVKSPQGLMERLNNSTCMGCHQGNSTAGFHFLGQDRAGFFGSTNQIRLPVSPHYFADNARREVYLSTAARGGSPDLFRPLSYAPLQGRPALVNEFCVVDGKAHFKDGGFWNCEPPAMECRPLVRNEALHLQIGQCVPKVGREDLLFAGQSCREGPLDNHSSASEPTGSPELPYNFFSFKDRWRSGQVYRLPENKQFSTKTYNCRPTEIGVPLGRTFRNCTLQEKPLSEFAKAGIPEEICALVGGTAFDRCAEGNFHDCLAQIVVRGALDTCHSGRYCREDYMCQKLPLDLVKVTPGIAENLEKKQIGFCTPTYFLYQMRLDGHVTADATVRPGR